ncbi:MAG: hypothetical protein ACI88H_000005 [Cocleimonas sp.]|jgi:uncharacterized protein YceH (UPF0502 family)
MDEDNNYDNVENQSQAEDNSNQTEAYFNALEARVIGALMEKHLTTPQNYPLTTNSLVNACNQKSNREPVMNLTEGQIGHTVNGLVDRKLAGIDYGERANKITHRVCNELEIDRKQQALLTVMLLRSAQTLNDLKMRTARMVEFDDINDIHETIHSMINRDMPLAVLIPKGSGRREDRFTHLLCGEIDISTLESDKAVKTMPNLDNDRLDAIEARLTVIEEKLGISIEL